MAKMKERSMRYVQSRQKDPTIVPLRTATGLRAAPTAESYQGEVVYDQHLDRRIWRHEERTVATGYGEAFSLPVLRKWIDKIGFQPTNLVGTPAIAIISLDVSLLAAPKPNAQVKTG